MDKWEYTMLYAFLGDDFSDDAMNELGKLGWELVSLTETEEEDSLVAYFKRKLGKDGE